MAFIMTLWIGNGAVLKSSSQWKFKLTENKTQQFSFYMCEMIFFSNIDDLIPNLLYNMMFNTFKYKNVFAANPQSSWYHTCIWSDNLVRTNQGL